jgi:hypothetical protein
MFTLRMTVLGLLVSLLPLGQSASAAVLICDDVGFFGDFLEETLPVTGTCDDPDQKVMVRHVPRGIELVGLGDNPPIKLNLLTDTSASAKNITQFGMAGHTMTARITKGSDIKLHLENNVGGSCDAIAKGGSRCIYEVTNTSCPTAVLIGDKVCAGCTNPTSCPDLSTPATYYVQGTPTFECNLTLTRVSTQCRNCTGLSISPKQ